MSTGWRATFPPGQPKDRLGVRLGVCTGQSFWG
jgi:hypothetical protein